MYNVILKLSQCRIKKKSPRGRIFSSFPIVRENSSRLLSTQDYSCCNHVFINRLILCVTHITSTSRSNTTVKNRNEDIFGTMAQNHLIGFSILSPLLAHAHEEQYGIRCFLCCSGTTGALNHHGGWYHIWLRPDNCKRAHRCFT